LFKSQQQCWLFIY